MILFFTFFSIRLSAQNQHKHTISGYLSDSLTTEILTGGSIYCPVLKAGNISNQYGFYSLTLPQGEVSISYSFVGYATKTVRFNLVKDTVINFGLAPSLALDEVVVTANRVQKTQMSSFSVPITNIKSLPAFLGETDLLKALQLLPGIQSGNEGSSGLYVRGGGPDQNLLLLDGVPVYNAAHLFGFFSVFNTDAINHIEVYKGGFPARYGGRISSVVDINMKEGSTQEYHGEGSVGLLANRITFGGPIVKGRTSFIVSGRLSYLDYITRPTVDAGYHFYDLNAKINHKFSEKDRIYFSTYLGNDDFNNKQEKTVKGYASGGYSSVTTKNSHALKWGNITSVFRWNHIFSGKLFSNINLTYSKYQLRGKAESYIESRIEDRIETELSGLRNSSGIEDWACRIGMDYLPFANHHIRFGGSSIYHIFNQGMAAVGEFSKTNDKKTNAFEHALFVEDDMVITRKLKANIGIRWSAFDVQQKFYQSYEPRITLSYLPTEQITAKGSYSRMAQYTQLLTNTGVGFPTDLWVPSTALLKPQTADQYALGVEYHPDKMYELSLEGYYKKMNHVLEYKEGTSLYKTETDWEQKVSQGTGQSYGVELFLQKKQGNLTGWVGYTLAWSDRKFEDINNGQVFPYKYDRRHDANIVLNYRLNKKIELSTVWVFGSGICATIPVSFYNVYPLISGYPDDMIRSATIVEYSKRNEYRMTPYHRMDIGISFIKATHWGERRWIIGVYNVYAHKNPYFFDFQEDFETKKIKYYQVSLFPIFPSVSYQFKF